MLSFQTVAKNKPGSTHKIQSTLESPQTVSPAVSTASASDPTDATAPADALQVIDLHKSFRSGFLKRRLRGIEGVSFTVPRGTVFALLGHNGAGKTTTINCILDLVHPDRGEVRIMGQDHRRCESRARVGYLPERPYFFEHLTGRELMVFYAQLLGLPRAQHADLITAALERTGMADAAPRRLKKYSKGMLQRIGLAQTLLGDPDLLILDEPMSGLDPMGRRDVRELLLELKAQGKTIILSSHIVPDVEAIADSVGILREGRLIQTRNLQDLNTGDSYQVNIAGWSSARDDGVLPAWVPERTRTSGADRLCVNAADVGQLRELLAACHAGEIPVQAVATIRTGLEDLFMAAHADAAPEVIS